MTTRFGSPSHSGDSPRIGQRLQRDSRLLAVLGAPGEDKTGEDETYLDWIGTAQRPIRFVARNRLCK